MSLGGPELLIILLIVILLFGVGRIARVGRELGTGVREFRQGLSEADDSEDKKEDEKENGSN